MSVVPRRLLLRQHVTCVWARPALPLVSFSEGNEVLFPLPFPFLSDNGPAWINPPFQTLPQQSFTHKKKERDTETVIYTVKQIGVRKGTAVCEADLLPSTSRTSRPPHLDSVAVGSLQVQEAGVI